MGLLMVRLICTLQRKLNYVVDKSGAKMRPAAYKKGARGVKKVLKWQGSRLEIYQVGGGG